MSNITTRPAFSLAPRNIEEAMTMANTLAKSTLVPREFQNNPGNILVAIQWGYELGLQPLQAMQNIAVINGRPSVWGDAMLAIVRGSGLLESIEESVENGVATCTIKRVGENPVTRSFSTENAKRAGLWGKAGPWTHYPERMLQMRARAFALRDVFPDVLRGMYIAEEAQDIPERERDMGAVDVVEPPAASKTEAVKARVRAAASRRDKAESAKAAVAEAVVDHAQDNGASPTATPAVEDVLDAIQRAASLDDLTAAADLARGLPEENRAAVRAAFKARRDELIVAKAEEV